VANKCVIFNNDTSLLWVAPSAFAGYGGTSRATSAAVTGSEVKKLNGSGTSCVLRVCDRVFLYGIR